MSTGNPFVDAVIARRTGYLGPFLCGALVQCIQTGIILDQASRYYFTWEISGSDGTSPRVKEKILVGSVVAIACFQTVAAIWSMFAVHVTHFGDWFFALDLGWADKMQPIVTISMAAPVQTFLIWRVVKALNRRWWAILPLFALQTVSVITAIITTVQAFQVDFGAPSTDSDVSPPPLPPPGTPLPIDPTYVIYLSASAGLDAVTTTILAVYLLRSRLRSPSDYTRNLIRRLIFVIWQAALPPAACALAGVVVYIATVRASAHSEIFGVRPGFWDLFFQLILGKFYVISLLATVNSRAELLRSATAMTTDNISLPTRSGRGRLTQVPVAISVNVTRTSVTDSQHKSPVGARSPRRDDDASTFELKGIRETTEGGESTYGQAV